MSMLHFEDIRVGETITVVPNPIKSYSSIFDYCKKFSLKEHTALVVGKFGSSNSTLGLLAPGNDMYVYDFSNLYTVPDRYIKLYNDEGFLGITEDQCLNFTLIGGVEISDLSVINDNGGFSLL